MSHRLKELLVENGITQAELSRASGVSSTTINKICNEKRSVSKTTQYKILRGLKKLINNDFKREEVFGGGGAD